MSNKTTRPQNLKLIQVKQVKKESTKNSIWKTQDRFFRTDWGPVLIKEEKKRCLKYQIQTDNPDTR